MKYFSETMTSREARTVLFSYADCLNKEEFEAVKEEYKKIVPEIIKREFRENDGWMTE